MTGGRVRAIQADRGDARCIARMAGRSGHADAWLEVAPGRCDGLASGANYNVRAG